jgi:hypothetical protein
MSEMSQRNKCPNLSGTFLRSIDGNREARISLLYTLYIFPYSDLRGTLVYLGLDSGEMARTEHRTWKEHLGI